jgi:predicted deacetylase
MNEDKLLYLIRFDDICATMNWNVWEEIEKILLKYNIKPIMAVVPDNKDDNLKVSEERDDFWICVKRWQEWGWTIALHGYQHKYINKNRGILGITPNSEFAGLNRKIQEEKINAGLKIFKKNEIKTITWVAPSHSFDKNTIDILKKNGIKIISDGFYNNIFEDGKKMIWIPCQLWDRITIKTKGTYTVCYHHNKWDQKKLEEFKTDIKKYRNVITNVPEIITNKNYKKISILSRCIAFIKIIWGRRVKLFLKKIIKIEYGK